MMQPQQHPYLVSLLNFAGIDATGHDNSQPDFSDFILDALNHVPENDTILTQTFQSIQQRVLDVLSQLSYLTPEQQTATAQKLEEYRCVDELRDFQFGSFLRWIPRATPISPTATKVVQGGGLLCNMTFAADGGGDVLLVCKNFVGKFYTIRMKDFVIFQKLSTFEKIVLAAIQTVVQHQAEEEEKEERELV